MFRQKVQLIFLILNIFPFDAPARVHTSHFSEISLQELQSGDLLLLPLDCRLCRLIRDEENTNYSHIGVVIGDQIAEAWGSVKLTSTVEFTHRKLIPNTPIKVLRDPTHASNSSTETSLLNYFYSNFNGIDYDGYFIWNSDQNPNDAMYCTEFAYFFLNPFHFNLPEPKPMHYQANRSDWIRYFLKLNPPLPDPPDLQPGLSPGDFERHPGFITYVLNI